MGERLELKYKWTTTDGDTSVIAFELVDDEAAPVQKVAIRFGPPARPAEGTASANLPTRAIEWAADYVEGLVVAGVIPSDDETYFIEFGDDLSSDLLSVQGPSKNCEFLSESKRSSVCSIGTQSDGRRTILLQTTPLQCENSCPLPDSRWLCTSAVNISVNERMQGRGAHPTSMGRAVAATCREGVDIEEDIRTCRPGGRECWRRSIDFGTRTIGLIHPLAFHEALDFLDIVWRQLFGSNLNQRTSASNTAAITLPAGTRDELQLRLGALKDVLDALIADTPLPNAPEGKEPVPGQLNRMKAAIAQRQPGNSRADAAIKKLQLCGRIRDKFEHGRAANELPKIRTRLGIRAQLTDWPNFWEEVRSIATGALIELRNAIREYGTGPQEATPAD